MIKKSFLLLILMIPAVAFCDDSCWINTYRFTDIEIIPEYDSVIGMAVEDFVCLDASDTIRLDCVSPVADSVKIATQNRYFYQTDSLLVISLDRTYNPSETLEIAVYFRAVPVNIPIPFATGGIFITPTLIYSCHAPFGLKTWVPCLDNHRHKAAVRQYYTVPENLYVVSNGVLDSVIQLSGNRKKYFWRETEHLSPYLQGLAAYDYSLSSYSVGGVPVLLAAFPQDSSALAYDLRRLDTMLLAYEERYGDYPFEKIAYAEVNLPGAMENQNCILAGSSVITGTGANEILFAHELSHMWWGDYVTTESIKEVWFNEGMATFSEGIFVEKISGVQAMHNYMHQRRTQYIGWEGTNGIYPMYDPPWEHYYSELTYERPGTVFYALRYMIGDSAFFASLQNLTAIFGSSTVTWQDVDSIFSDVSCEDLTWFFEQWVLGSGTPWMRWTALSKSAGTDSVLVRAWTFSNSSTDFTIKAPLFIYQGNDTAFYKVTASRDTFDNFFAFAPDSVCLDPLGTQFTSSTARENPEISALLALDEAILVQWSPCFFGDLTGYNVYGAPYGTTFFEKLNPALLTDTTFLAQNLTNGVKYTFFVTFEIQGGWESYPSDTSSTTPVPFPFDRRILVVDETEGGNGTQPHLPTDAQVDSAYAALLIGINHDVYHCDTSLPDLTLLGHYQCVVWHSDEYTSTSLIKNQSQLIRSYITAGGKIILSGWRVFELSPPDFLALFGVTQASVVTQKNFEVSVGKNGFPDVYVNSSLMPPSWNGKMDRATYFETFGSDTLGVWGNGYPQTGKTTTAGSNDSIKFVVNGYPLYFMEHQNARDFLVSCFTYLGQVGIDENFSGQEPAILPVLRLCPEGVEILLSSGLAGSNFDLMIYDVAGRLVFRREFGFSERTVYHWTDSEGKLLPQGNYFINVEYNGTTVSGKYFYIQ
ncbi:hypothetical protein JXL83_03990 [candidate division WOR-3 bacterium]|nr:hypothetical protein [candidate division WOR-3 bacterium]